MAARATRNLGLSDACVAKLSGAAEELRLLFATKAV
jgi:hypothetical protein